MKAAREFHGSGYLVAHGSAAWGWKATLGAAVAIAGAYFLAARLGLALRLAHSDVAVFWPASGIAAGILIVFGRRAVPGLLIGVVVGTIAAGLVGGRGPLTSLFNGTWNAGEALLAARLLERWFGRSFTFGNLGRVAGFVAAAGIATTASAIAGAATLTLLHTDTTAPYWDVWREWFLSSWVGIVVLAPLVIEAAQVWRKPPPRKEWIEGVVVLGLTAVACSYTMAQQTGSWLSFTALVFPLLLWLTARCQPAFGIAGAFVASTEIILVTTFGIGRFGDAAVPITQRVAGAQVAMMTVTLFTLVLAVLFAQRKEAEERLAKERTMLARLHEVGARLWLKRDLREALDEILAGAVELLGADMGAIRILDAARGVLKIEAQRGFKQDYLNCFGEMVTEGGSPCCRGARSAERIVVEDVEADPLFTNFRPMARDAGFRAVQSTPIMNREGMLLGTLATHFRSVHQPAKQELHLLDLYVRQAADIIERHKAEDALRQSEERLRLAQLRTGVGIWDRDLRTGRPTWTRELEALCGLEPGTVTCYADFRDVVHPDDIVAYEAQRDAAVQDRKTFNVELRIIRADGQVRWMSVTGGAVYDEVTGEPCRILGNFADITERKLAELALAERNAQLALAGRAALVGAYAYDVETETVQISEGYAAIFGFPEGTTELERIQCRARVHPEDLENVDDVRNQAFRERQGEYNVQYRIVLPGRGVRWIESRTFISYDGDGHPRRVVGVNIEVTERKRAEERQSVLVAELDHRVKNVLASVSAVVSNTRHESRSGADFVAALDGRIRSMATTHELLSVSRWQGISLAELVRRELAPYKRPNNTSISGPEVLLKSEAGQAIAMVLHELVTNAAKYGAFSTRSGHVAIRWHRQTNGHARSQLVLEWQEIGGPPVVSPGEASYGTRTIRDLIPYEFGGSVELVFASEGVLCRLELPADWINNNGEPDHSSARPTVFRVNSARQP